MYDRCCATRSDGCFPHGCDREVGQRRDVAKRSRPLGRDPPWVVMMACQYVLRRRGRHEDDMLDARLHGRVDGSDVLRPALSGFRIDGRDGEQTIETRIGLRQAFGPVVRVMATTSCPPRRCSSSETTALPKWPLAPLTPIFMSASNTSPTNKSF